MQRKERFFFINLACLLFIFLSESHFVFSQQIEFISAEVIVERDLLRLQPSITSPSQAVVVKGAKLKVAPSQAVSGWYLAYLEEAPTVGGYIHGNSIRLRKPQTTKSTKRKTTSNNNVTVLPKTIILDDAPSLEAPKDKNQKISVNKNKSSNSKTTKQAETRSNYCQPPLYCPDIDQVQVALFDNTEKFQKGKFEKTADWEKRKPTILRDVKLAGGYSAADKIYFLYDLETGASAYGGANYDADKEQWSFILKFQETSDGTCLPIMSQGSGQMLCLTTQRKMGANLEAFVSMPPPVAAANENKLQVAFVGKIIEPYLWSSQKTSSRDISSGIYFNLEEIICINPQTGQRWKINIPTKVENSPKTSRETQNEITPSEEEIKEQLKREIIKDPMNAKAHLELGTLYFKRSDYDNAISSLKTSLTWNNRLIDAAILLSRIYFIRDDCQQAKDYTKTALEIDSQNQDALNFKKLIDAICSKTTVNPTATVNNTSSALSENLDKEQSSSINEKHLTFEGQWKISIIDQNQTIPFTLSIEKNGKKYKAFLINNSSQYSKSFEVKLKGKSFKFKTSGVNNYIPFTINFEGEFQNNSLSGFATVKSLGMFSTYRFTGTQ
jgi:hypothetical protein